MSGINKTLMQGLTERDMQGVVNTFNLNPFYYPTLFGLKPNASLTWKTLAATAGLNIAGDIVARGATLDPKTREAIERIQGDIPKIAVKRIKDERELEEYQIMLSMAQGNAGLKAIIDVWAEDVNFAWKAVNSRLEWIALQELSLGKVTLTNANNGSVVPEFGADYGIDASQKSGVSTVWSVANAATATPISDLAAVIKTARSKHISPKFALMSADTFAIFANCAEVVKLCNPLLNTLAGANYTPSLEQINTALKGMANLYGLQIKVIDQEVTIEKADGTRTTANPFQVGNVTLVESLNCGNTFYKIPAAASKQGSAAINAIREHVLIKKYSTEEPDTEVTIGQANAFPAWTGATRSFLIDTLHTSWSY